MQYVWLLCNKIEKLKLTKYSCLGILYNSIKYLFLEYYFGTIYYSQ